MNGHQLLAALIAANERDPSLLAGPLYATHGNDENGNANLIEIENILPCDDLSINGTAELLSTSEKPVPNPNTPVLVLASEEPLPVQSGKGFTKGRLLDALMKSPASNDTVVLICETNPSGNFDNSGLQIDRVSHDINPNPDPGDLGIIYLLASGVEQQPTRGTIEPEGVYVTDTLFANWPETDGGFRIRVLDEHGNCVETLDMICGDPIEQARWHEVRDLMPDDALYFQPEGAGDHDDEDVPESVRNMNSYEVYRDYDACRKAHPEGNIMGFQFAEIDEPKFLDVEEPKLYWNE